jgi:Matrixin/PKD domain
LLPFNGQETDHESSIVTNRGEGTHNHAPKAYAGNDQVVKELEKAELDGSKSIDPDGDKLTYSWQFLSPKSVKINLDNDHSVKPSFAVPGLDLPVSKITLVFRLTVSDGDLKSSDMVRVIVTLKNEVNHNNNGKTNTLTIVDSGYPPSKNQFFAQDVCGDGTSVYSYLVPGVKWKTFPVTFGFDFSTTPGGGNAWKTRDAIRLAFQHYDSLEQPAGTFFRETTYASAMIKITWKYIDGPYNQLGKTTFSYRTDTHAITSATITFDSGDTFFISSTERCGVFGNQFDMQDVATHEIGHAINLGHVSDRLQSMYPTIYAGETLKRTLGNGDRLGVSNLY